MFDAGETVLRVLGVLKIPFRIDGWDGDLVYLVGEVDSEDSARGPVPRARTGGWRAP